jgi:hypothetical protein
MAMEMTEFVTRMRAAADFFEAHPDLGVPTHDFDFRYYGSVNGKSVDSVEGLAEFTRIVGGRVDKVADENYYRLVAERDGFSVGAIAYRNNVCERVQVGTKIEPGHVIPASPEVYVAAREVPIYEFHCPSLLARKEEPVAEEAEHVEA